MSLFGPVALLALAASAGAFGSERRSAKTADPQPSKFRVIYPILLPDQTPKLSDEDRATARLDVTLVPVKRKLAQELPVFGHRNWIVVADSAYPAQSRPGIETIYVGGDQAKTVEAVLQAIDAAKHVRGIVYVDAELEHLPEEDAPGVGAYRKKLTGLLKRRPVRTMPHDEVIAHLDQAAKTFRILIIKTDIRIPYTTVFIELECGYWSADQEKGLREAIDAEGK